MARALLHALGLCAALIGHAHADAPPSTAPGAPASVALQPVAVYDADGNIAFGAGGGVLTLPFQRTGKVFALPVSTAPQTYAVTQPSGSRSYRGINPCSADIVIASVTVTTPVTTQPVTMNGKTVPGVQRVTSSGGAVDEFADTYFLARTGRTIASSPNPMPGTVRYVSIMALAEPAAPCAFRLGYGNGS